MEQLIELVRAHPVLYDKNHPDYMKIGVKDEIWARLAAELDYRDGMDIKEQWRKLRECHREALRRQYNKRRRNHGLYPTKMWMYQKQMEFLLPFMTQRGPDTTLFQECGEEESCGQFKMEDSSEDQPSTSEVVEHRPRSKRKLKAEEADHHLPVPEPIFERHKSEELEARGSLVAELANESLYHFFMCMYNTAKNMPLSTQLKVKKRIFEVVVEAEEELFESSMELGVHHLV